MSLLSRIKSAFSRVFGGGGSSSSSRSSSSRATRRSTPTNYYRSSRGGSAYGGSNAGYEDPKVTAARKARERQKDTVKALASLSKQKSSIERQYNPRGNEGKGFNLAVKKLGEKATPPDAKLKQDMAQASRDRATARLKSIEKKMPKVKSDTAMIRSGDYEYRPKAKNLNTPSADSRSSTRLTLQGYKKRMDNNAYRVSESFARGFGSDATFGTLDTLMRGNKDDKTEQAIEKYYQENKSSAAETAGRITGALLGFGLTGDLATSLGKEIAPAFIKKGGKYATEYLAKNPTFRKFAAKEAKKAGAEITEEVIERFAKQRAERIMGAVGKDVAINWTTGGLMDVNYALRDTYDENNGNFDARDFGKNLAKNRAWNYGLGGLLTVPPALRTQKGLLKEGLLGTNFLKKGARDDALELAGRIAEESSLRQAMTDAFVRDGDNAVRQFNMNDLLAQNSPFRQADEAVRPQTLDEAIEKAAVDTVEKNTDDAARTVTSPQNTIGEQDPLEAQVDDALDEMIASAQTVEDFQELFGLPRALAEILAEDRARVRSGTAPAEISDVVENGIPIGNIKPLAENLRSNEFLTRSGKAQYVRTPRSAKRVDTSIEGLTKRLDELKGQTANTDRERRAIETKINDVTEILNRAKWRREGGADMDAMRKAYRSEYAGFDMSKSTNSYQSDVLEGKIKGKTATIVEMSPDEYLERTYRQIFKKPTEKASAFSETPRTQKYVKEYAEAMRNGEKFPLPYLDYSTAQQEGRHRALAAKAAGIEKIPVVIIDNESNPKAIIDEVAEATAKAKVSLDRKRKTDISVKPRDIRQENRALREEREQIVRELEDEFGSTRIDYNKLTPEQRAVATEKKLRLQEIDKQIEQNGRTLRQETRRVANAEKEPPRVSKAEREKELAKLRSEHSRLRKEIRDAEKNLESGKAEVDVDELNVKRTRLDELKDKIDRIETTTGTSAKPRKVRSDKGTKKTKATPPTEKVQAEPKVEPTVEPRKYEDIDLSEGLTKEDHKVIRSKMRELEAERNQLQAQDDKNPRIEELGAEIGKIQRALKRETGVPAKKVNVEEVKAKQAAEEAQAKIDRNANSKPIKKAKPEPPKADQAEPKVKPPKKEKIIDEEKEHARLVREANEKLDEAGRLLREKSEGKYNVRQSAKTAVELGSNEQDKRYIKQISKSIENFEQGIIDTDASYVYKVNTKASRDELAQKAFANARKSPDTIINDLKAKVADDVELGIEDVANMNAVMSMYHELGEQAPKEMEELAGRVQMQALTEKAQGLKSISLFLRENDPVYRKRYLNKDFVKFRELVCDERDWAKISASLDKKKGVEGYLDKEIAKLANLTGKENEKAFREAYVNLQRDIWRNSEPTRWELLNLIRHTFMLGSLKTSDNNLIGNFAQSSMWEVSDKMYALAEALASKTAKGKGMERTTTFKVKNKELRTFMNQIRSGTVAEEFEKLGAQPKQYADAKFGELLENARAEDVGNAMGTSKYGFKADKGWDFQYNSKLKKWSRKAIQAPAKAVGLMLSEPDSWFVERNYRKALARYLDSNGIHTAEAWEKNPELIKRAREYALDIAKENTYKKSARLVSFLEGQRAKGYRKGAKWTDVLKTIGLDAELPYLRVPYNLVVNNFKYSPVGLATNSVKALKAAYKGDTEALVKATKEMSKGLTGTGMMIAGFYLNCDDQMDENSSGFIADAKDYLKEYGIRDNSLKIGNKNYNLANFGIGTVEYLMGAKLAEDINSIGGAPESFLDYPEAVMAAFGTTFDVVADMSIMENGLAIFDAISNWGDYDIELSERIHNVLAKVAGDYAGQYVPAPARAAARSFTSSDLDTGVKKGTDTTRAQRTIQRSANNVINSIPVLNEKVLPHKVDRHGNYVNERKTSADKWKAFGSNMTNPFSPREVNIPEADKVELSLTKDNGEPYQPKGYDENREYKGKVGQGKHAQTFDLTAKEREQAARSYKYSGEDMADNLVYSKNAWFGDSHGDRAQQILANVPADEEKAREYFYSTPEFQKLSPDMKLKFVKDLYDSRRGRGRTANHEVFVNIKGGSEGDFRYQNDLAWQQQDKYEDNHLADYGITKEQWADIVEAARFESHKYKDGQNVDTINSAYKLKAALMSLDLSPEARIAAYNAYRGKRNSFGWYDWDGQTLKGYSRKGRRRSRRYRRRYYSSGSKSATVPKPKTIKATSFAQGEALVSKSKSSSSKKATPPQLKRVQAKIDLPTKR